MIAPAEIAARHTDLTGESFAQLQRLMASWGALSDLSFSDLLLLVPLRESIDGQMVVLGQIRPTTGATLIRVDLVGHFVEASDWPGAEEAIRTHEISQGNISIEKVLQPSPLSGSSPHTAPSPPPAQSPPPPPAQSPPGTSPAASPGAGTAHYFAYTNVTGEVPAIDERGQLECLPVPWKGEVVAVLARVGPLAERRTGRLEKVYGDLYHRLATMVVAGDFPYAGEEVVSEDAPRVGDGLLVTDGEGRITYSSPNAMSALHRMGVSEAVEGRRLSELGVEEAAIDSALATGKPVIEEIERRPDVIVLLHCTPLVRRDRVTGAMVLLRDVTDLRRLDRLLLSKDAAIREVHHRVKNNLQTISSLLRLQARRLEPGRGREELREAERRVRSIAVVHEILSRDPGDQVSFGEIVDALVRMTEDSIVPGHRIEINVECEARDIPADVATPLAVVLAELLQNAAEHAYTGPADDIDHAHRAEPAQSDQPDSVTGGSVDVRISDDDGRHLKLQVRDDGIGLPPGFDIDNTTSLGLSIVRDLVRSQLGGTISMSPALSPGESSSPDGCSADGSPNSGRGRGTMVDIEVPLAEG